MTRLKRILAYFLDHLLIWVVTGLITAFIVPPVLFFVGKAPFGGVLVLLFVIFGYLALVILRDRIFRGRSIGKRIFGLYVYDKASGTPALRGQTVVRNLLFFISGVDGIVLLATGETLGDRMAHAIVVDRRAAADLDARANDNPRTQEEIDTANAALKKSNRRVVLIFCAVILAFLLFCGAIAGIAFLALHWQTNTEEYRIAREYLVTSDAFRASGAEEEAIRFTSFERSLSINESTTVFGFTDGHHSYEIVCHKVNGEWQVCEECTEFD